MQAASAPAVAVLAERACKRCCSPVSAGAVGEGLTAELHHADGPIFVLSRRRSRLRRRRCRSRTRRWRRPSRMRRWRRRGPAWRSRSRACTPRRPRWVSPKASCTALEAAPLFCVWLRYVQLHRIAPSGAPGGPGVAHACREASHFLVRIPDVVVSSKRSFSYLNEVLYTSELTSRKQFSIMRTCAPQYRGGVETQKHENHFPSLLCSLSPGFMTHCCRWPRSRRRMLRSAGSWKLQSWRGSLQRRRTCGSRYPYMT